MFWLLNKGTLFYTKRYFLLSVMEMDVGRWEQIGVKLEGKKPVDFCSGETLISTVNEGECLNVCVPFTFISFFFFYYRSASCRVPRCIELDIDISVISVYHLLIALSLPLHLSIALFLSPTHLYRDLSQYPSSYLSNAILNLFLLISITLEI